MKLRRMATTVAATSALALVGAAPAFADHGDDPGVVEKTSDDPGIPGGNITCEQLEAQFPGHGSHTTLESKVEDPADGDQGLTNVTATVVGQELTVVALAGFEVSAVIVKGGQVGSNVYFEDFVNMTAPVNPSGQPADISNYTICGGDVEPPDGEEPNGEEPDGEEPNGEEEDGMGGGEPTETPAAVPTEIPAGVGTADAGTAGTAGLVAMVAAFAAGVAVIVRRRFLAES